MYDLQVWELDDDQITEEQLERRENRLEYIDRYELDALDAMYSDCNTIYKIVNELEHINMVTEDKNIEKTIRKCMADIEVLTDLSMTLRKLIYGESIVIDHRKIKETIDTYEKYKIEAKIHKRSRIK